MEATFDHNKILKTIVKDRLKPYGITQKGNSRTFLYDGEWYIIIIEFQPSSWTKGSYLNVGVELCFYPRDYLAFSYGYREKSFNAADAEKQFTEIVNDYCDQAILRTQELKEEFKDIPTAIDNIKQKYLKDNLWDYYDLGILYGLAGNTKKAEFFFSKLRNFKCEYDYQYNLKNAAIEVMNLLTDNERFVAHAKELMAQSRLLKKLPA